MTGKFTVADRSAKKQVGESRVRQTEQASEGWVIIHRAVWLKRCVDETCLKNITQLAKEMGKTAIAFRVTARTKSFYFANYSTNQC